uniref:Uncharacterized protein n=1 Tax=Oryza glumipatula TaxID=40148 RepID=A0A0D9YG40_9ORYZ
MESGGIDWDVRARRGHRLALLTGWGPAHASSSSAEERRMAWPGQWRTRKGAFSRVLSLNLEFHSTNKASTILRLNLEAEASVSKSSEEPSFEESEARVGGRVGRGLAAGGGRLHVGWGMATGGVAVRRAARQAVACGSAGGEAGGGSGAHGSVMFSSLFFFENL